MFSGISATARWFELYGPGLKARGIEWSYDFDSDTYKFYRMVRMTGETLSQAAHKEAHQIAYDIGKRDG